MPDMPVSATVHSFRNRTYTLLPRAEGHVLIPTSHAHGQVSRLRQLPGAR